MKKYIFLAVLLAASTSYAWDDSFMENRNRQMEQFEQQRQLNEIQTQNQEIMRRMKSQELDRQVQDRIRYENRQKSISEMTDEELWAAYFQWKRQHMQDRKRRGY